MRLFPPSTSLNVTLSLTFDFFRSTAPCVLITMKLSTFILSILGTVACVSAQNTNTTTKTAELLEGLQKAPTRLARLNVLQDNTDVSTPYHLL